MPCKVAEVGPQVAGIGEHHPVAADVGESQQAGGRVGGRAGDEGGNGQQGHDATQGHGAS